MRLKLVIFLILLMPSLLVSAQHDPGQLTKQAEALFRSVYEDLDTMVIDQIASEKIVSSYPVFIQIFDKKALHGKKEYKEFAMRFNGRWKNSKVTIDETISEGNRVVLIWTFSAQRVEENEAGSIEEQSWGGITIFRFDDTGKVIEEIGEESSPGPYGRIK